MNNSDTLIKQSVEAMLRGARLRADEIRAEQDIPRERPQRRKTSGGIELADIMTVRQVASECGYAVRTIYDWVHKGQIKYRKTKSGRIRILRRDLLVFLGCTDEEVGR